MIRPGLTRVWVYDQSPFKPILEKMNIVHAREIFIAIQETASLCSNFLFLAYLVVGVSLYQGAAVAKGDAIICGKKFC